MTVVPDSDYDSGDPQVVSEAWGIANMACHLRLLDGRPNARLRDIAAGLRDNAELYRSRSQTIGGEPDRDVAAEHPAMLDRGLAREADRGVEVLRNHTQHTADLLIGRAHEPARAATRGARTPNDQGSATPDPSPRSSEREVHIVMIAVVDPSAPLAGQAAVVTGAAQGIGRGVAQALADRDAVVIATDVLEAKLGETAEVLADRGTTVVHDVTQQAAGQRVMGVAETRGPVTALVKNAGVIEWNVPNAELCVRRGDLRAAGSRDAVPASTRDVNTDSTWQYPCRQQRRSLLTSSGAGDEGDLAYDVAASAACRR